MKYLAAFDLILCFLSLVAVVTCGCEASNQPAEQPVKIGIVEKVDVTGNYGKYIIVNTDGKRELLWWSTVDDLDGLWEKAKVGEELEYHD